MYNYFRENRTHEVLGRELLKSVARWTWKDLSSAFLLFFAGTISLSAFQVTFKVDMSQVVISPNGVHLTGDFQGWNASSSPMTNVGNGIYCLVVDLAPGTYEFKYINGNTFGPDELVPQACGTDDGIGGYNRLLTVGSADVILDLVCFGQCSTCSTGLYALNGNAFALGADCYALTGAAPFQNGTVWYGNQLDLTQPFDLQFLLNLGVFDGNGADGVVFVLQRLGSNAIGVSGGGMGFQSFGTSFGVEFDTYQNPEFSDPPEDHIAAQINGNVSHFTALNLAGPVQMSALSPNTEDGTDHVVQITWDPATFLLSVYFDCTLRLSLNYDISSSIFFGQSMVYWGFTGATGSLVNVQRVCLQNSAIQVNELTMCPGGAVQLSGGSSSNGIWQWNPPDYLDDPFTSSPVATPPVTTVYSVDVTDLCSNSVTRTVTVNVLPSGPPCSVNPVVLTDFSAERLASGRSDQISWTTYSEEQNEFFTIEGSVDGVHFDPLKDTPGAGNSFLPKSYSSLIPHHFQPMFYRLRQTDWNGSTVIVSPALFVSASATGAFSVSVSGDRLARVYGDFSSNKYTLSCFTMTGQLLRENRNFTSTDDFVELSLPPGLLLLLLTDSFGNRLLSQRIP